MTFNRRTKGEKTQLPARIFAVFLALAVAIPLIYTPSSAYAIDVNHTHEPIQLTDEEKQYIKDNPLLTITSYPGLHPILGIDENNEIIGISYEVLKMIEDQTGLKFKIKQYDNLTDAINGCKNSEVDIISSISDKYKSKYLPEYESSKPYLVSKSVIVYRKDVDINQLQNLRLAMAEGSTIPKIGKNSPTQEYPTWENCLLAVSNKNTDYTICNELSFTHYIHELSISNLKSVPLDNSQATKMVFRLTYINDDPLLASIVNKAMDNICDIDLQSCMLRGIMSTATHIDSMAAFMEKHRSVLIHGTVLITILILCLYINTIRQSSKIKTLNNLIFSLSSASNEYIYIYDTKKDQIKLVEQFVEILNNMEETKSQLDDHMPEIINPSKSKLNKNILDIFTGKVTTDEIVLHDLNGNAHTFRVYQNIEQSKNKNNVFATGKFVDITEAKEYEQKSKCDSMTGLYNALTTKELIENSLKSTSSQQATAMFIIDIDFFKTINDTYGHMKGDETIVTAAETFKAVFRTSDIIGRIGGDEFCIFISGPFDQTLVERKAEELKKVFYEKTSEIGVNASLSIGISIQYGINNYNDIYANADSALYERKNTGRNGYTISNLV